MRPVVVQPHRARTSRRYSTAVVKRARDLYEAGWTPHQIQRLLEGEGMVVAFATVKAWVDEDYRMKRNRISGEDKRRQRDKSGEHAKRRMKELRERGLSYDAISVVMELYHGRNISGESVRNFCEYQPRGKAA